MRRSYFSKLCYPENASFNDALNSNYTSAMFWTAKVMKMTFETAWVGLLHNNDID